jgi:flagellar protein FliO/FliZ
MLIPLFFILLILGGTWYLVRKFSVQKGAVKNSLLNIEVISTKMVLPKKYISVIKIKDELFVIGMSDNSITLLKEMELADDDLRQINEISDQPGFAQILKKNLGMK